MPNELNPMHPDWCVCGHDGCNTAAGYERLESGEELQPHNAGDSYCKKFCNKPTDDAIHDYDEDEQEFGSHQTARKALRI